MRRIQRLRGKGALPVMRLAGLLALLFGVGQRGCADSEDVDFVLVAPQDEDSSGHVMAHHLVLRSVSPSGQLKEVTRRPWPAGTFRVGGVDRGVLLAFEALGLDDAGQVTARGATVFHELWKQTQPIPVLAGSVGQVHLAPEAMPLAHHAGQAAIVDGRYLVSVGGTQARDAEGTEVSTATLGVYDVATWRAANVRLTLPFVPRTLAMISSRVAFAVADDVAALLDLIGQEAKNIAPPRGFAWDEVAGGGAYYGNYGGQSYLYLVGATRRDKPSSAVFVVDSLGNVRGLRSGEPRTGASAAYVERFGLVLAGGSDTEPGVVRLTGDNAGFVPLAFGPDPTRGSVAAALDDGRVVLVGGRLPSEPAEPVPVRTFSLHCTKDCVIEPLGSLSPRIDVTHAQAWRVSEDEVVVVGANPVSDASTTLYTITGLTPKSGPPTVTTHPLRQPRSGATALALFGRTIAVLGGTTPTGAPALGLEIYIPR